MKKFIEIIKKKWLIDTSKTIFLIAILVIIFIFINIGIKQLDLTAIDVTKEKLYSLSDESKEKVKDIDYNVTIYFFGIEENTSIVDLAKQYSKVNDKISVENVDVSKRPDLAEKYGVSDGDQGIVVQSTNRSKILSTYDLSTYDYTTNKTIDVTEQKLTNAIVDTTIAKKPKIYFLSGHKESSKMLTLKTYLDNEVNDIQTLDLLSSEFPSDCDCLIIASPETDFMEHEANLIIEYINNGGNILWLNDSQKETYPNIQKVLDTFGVSIAKGIVREQNSKNMILNDSRYIVPSIGYHKITEHIITDGSLMFLESTKLNIVDDEKLDELNVTAEPFITSSSDSFFRTDATITSNQATENEEKGPFNLGVELTKKIGESKQSKLIIYANNRFATDSVTIDNKQISAIGIYSNKDLLLNSVAYLTDREDSITIRKDTGSVTYTATAQQDSIIRLIIFILPIVIIIIGLIIWQVRRRKK